MRKFFKAPIYVAGLCLTLILLGSGGGGNSSSSTTVDDGEKCLSKASKQIVRCDDSRTLVELTVFIWSDPPTCVSNLPNKCDPSVVNSWAQDKASWYEDLQYFGQISTVIDCCSGYGTNDKYWNSTNVIDCSMNVYGHTRYETTIEGWFYKPCSVCSGSVARYMPTGHNYIMPGVVQKQVLFDYLSSTTNC